MNNLLLIDNSIKGGIAQAKAEIRALEKGFIISKPIIEGTRYDMILDDGEKLSRVQVKYAGGKQTSSNGCVVVDFRKTSNNGKVKEGYSSKEVDVIIVYIPQVDKLCWFPTKLLEGKTTLTIRYEKAKNNQTKNVILVDDYIW